MNIKTNLPGYHVINKVLSENHRKAGLSLCESEDFVYLIQNGVCIARWYSSNAYVKSIMDTADRVTYSGDAVSEMLGTGAIEIEWT